MLTNPPFPPPPPQYTNDPPKTPRYSKVYIEVCIVLQDVEDGVAAAAAARLEDPGEVTASDRADLAGFGSVPLGAAGAIAGARRRRPAVGGIAGEDVALGGYGGGGRQPINRWAPVAGPRAWVVNNRPINLSHRRRL